MLAASYFFYGYWNWHFVFLLAVVDRRQPAPGPDDPRSADDERARRAVLAGAIVFNLGILGYFKYADFFVSLVA